MHSPKSSPLFLQNHAVILPRPHLFKLVDLADEEVPVAPSNLCVCDVDHVLGKEEHEVRKRTVLPGDSKHCQTGGAMKGASLQP